MTIKKMGSAHGFLFALLLPAAAGAFVHLPFVTSINGVGGPIILAAGANVTITPSGNKLTISAAGGGLGSVSHDATLAGNGSSGSPLGIAPGQTVRSLNGLTDSVTISAGRGVRITTSGNVVTVSASGRRKYYLTPGTYDGAHATGACAAGFHMASMWEILNPTGLSYDLNLGGTTADDQGSGPPANNVNGWIRTGFFSTGLSDPSVAAGSNCKAWSSNLSTDAGIAVRLANDWSVPLVGVSNYNPIAPWEATTFACDLAPHVWCVEDDPDQ